MARFYNLQRFLLPLCGLFLPCLSVKSSSNDSNSFPIVINTWAGNYKGATDKGDNKLGVAVLEFLSDNRYIGLD